ncbi:MAG: DUF6562 domain-containing protein [Rikenellaceae bacterium]
MNRLLKILYVALLVLAISSCKKVLESADPAVEPVDPTLVSLDVAIEVSISSYLEFQLYGAGTKSDGSDSYYLRTIIELYDQDDMTAPMTTQTLYNPYSDIENLNILFTEDLKAKKYTLAVWCDIVEEYNSGDNFFYTGSTLSQIKYLEPYVGNTELKSCFSDVVEIDLTPYADRWYGVYECNIELERPQAMFEIISTDLEKFFDKQGDSIDSDTNFENYTVKVSYDGYMPYGYNALTEKPNEAQQGISYMTNLEILSATEARLAFDQVFVNHTESGVNVSLVVYDENGDTVVEVSSQAITINRNMKTVITGEFLTSDYVPGIGIDPSFDGEYNIVIPD